MTTARYHIKDTNLDTWQVSPGDPAHLLVDHLKKLGYDPETIQLPIDVIVCGEATLQHLEVAEESLNNVLAFTADSPDDTFDTLVLSVYQVLTCLEAIHAPDTR